MNMENNVNLFTQLCVALNLNDERSKSKVWKILQGYRINSLSTNVSMISSINTFIKAKNCEDASPKTLNNYKCILRNFAVYVKNKPAADITAEKVRDYIVYLKETKQLKKTSIAHKISVIRTFYNWLYNQHLIQDNIMNQVKNIKVDNKAPRTPLTPQEVTRLKRACSDVREKAMIEFFLSTGCRVSEVVGIKTSEIDWENRCVTVLGKGNKYRTVYFSDKAKKYMIEWLDMSPNQEPLFCSKHFPYKAVQKNGLERIIGNLGRKAKLEQSLFPHKLRHTFATTCLQKGMDITIIQHLLGHNDIATTQIYAHITNHDLKRHYDKFVNVA